MQFVDVAFPIWGAPDEERSISNQNVCEDC